MYERKYKIGLTKEPVDSPLDLKAIYDKVTQKKTEQEKTQWQCCICKKWIAKTSNEYNDIENHLRECKK